MKGAKPGYSINEIRSKKLIMNQFKLFISPSFALWNSCSHSIKEENNSGVAEREFKSLADKMYIKTLTAKDPQKVSTFCLHHIVPILWESPKISEHCKS